MSDSDTGSIVLYATEDGQSRIECQMVDGTIWLSQALMAELFQRSKKTVSEHLQNIFEEGELSPESVIRNFRITAADGKTYEIRNRVTLCRCGRSDNKPFCNGSHAA